MLNYKRYRKNPVIDYPEREWPGKEIEKAPVWCSVESCGMETSADRSMIVEEKLRCSSTW